MALGLVVGFSLALHLNDVSARRPVIVIAGTALLLGLAAWKWRERFWLGVEAVLERASRWWWFW